jgi:hypothetical protein
MGALVRRAMLFSLMVSSAGLAQTSDTYTNRMSWTLFSEYSNTSSHILLGLARQREWTGAGVAVAWRLPQRIQPSSRGSFSYLAEFRPLVFESDVTQIDSETVTIPVFGSGTTVTSTPIPGVCQPFSSTQNINGATVTNSYSCGRHWTYAQALAPIGLKYSFRTHHSIQPFAVGTGGYMYSDHPIPVDNAGSFNFMFDFGAGIEIFRSTKRSIAIEARYHHFSNHTTAYANPGTDNLIYKVSYSFGR